MMIRKHVVSYYKTRNVSCFATALITEINLTRHLDVDKQTINLILNRTKLIMSLEEELADNISDADIEEQQKKAKALRPQRTFTKKQVKSYITILTSALGGLDHSSDIIPTPYKLGDEALLCLQDITKWLKTYDDQQNSYEVAIACAESELIQDLVTILQIWDDHSTKERSFSGYSKDYDNKLAKWCLQVLVLLTWPVDLSDGMYQEQLKSYSNLKKHKLKYKKLLLTYNGGSTFQTIIKLVLPVIAKPALERNHTDHGILRLCILFFKNVLAIEPAGISKKVKNGGSRQGKLNSNLPNGVDADDVSLRACIASFSHNKVFTFLLTICSEIGSDSATTMLVDEIIEIIHYLTKGLKPQYIMRKRNTNEKETNGSERSGAALGLSDLLLKEKEMKSKFQKNSSSRHGRFGTLLSLQTPDMGRLTVSGGGNLLGGRNPIMAFDAHKAWHKPERFRYQPGEEIIFPDVSIGASNRKIFQTFACDFIDGALNPFIRVCRTSLTREDVPLKTKIHFMLAIAWFLDAHRSRTDVEASNLDYGLVAEIIKPETFILLINYLNDSQEKRNKKWGLAHAALIAATEIFYIVDSMGNSAFEEYRDSATSIKENLFHKHELLDAFKTLPREAYKRAPEFTDTCVDLIDIVLKVFEEYANEDVYKTIVYKKTHNTKKMITKEQKEIDAIDLRDEQNARKEADKISQERKKQFTNHQKKLDSSDVVQSYIYYLKRYEDLPEAKLKKAIKFLHRIFFTNRSRSLLFRMDFLYIMHSMLSDEGLPKNARIRVHLNEFLTHYMRKLKKRLDSSPSLYVELMFPLVGHDSKMNYYLDTGDLLADKPKKATHVKYQVQIKNGDQMDLERKVAIMVAALIDEDKKEIVEWLSIELEKVTTKRLQDIAFDEAQGDNLDTPSVSSIYLKSDEAIKMKLLVTEPKIRYILKLADFFLPDSTESDCFFGSSSKITDLRDVSTSVKKYLMTPVEFEGEKVAADYIKVIDVSDTYGIDDDGYEGEYSSDEEIAFEIQPQELPRRERIGFNDDQLDNLEEAIERADGLNRGVARSKKKAKKKKAKEGKRAKENRYEAPEMHDISEDEEATRARKQKEEHKRAISSKYIVDSDEESDDEADRAFFEREQRLRELLNQNNGILNTEQVNQYLAGRDPTSASSPSTQTSSKNQLNEVRKRTVADTQDTVIFQEEFSDDDEASTSRKRPSTDAKAAVVKRLKRSLHSDNEDEDDESAGENSENQVELSSDSESESENHANGDSEDETPNKSDTEETVDITVEPVKSLTRYISEEEDYDDEEEQNHVYLKRKKANIVLSDDEGDE